MSGGRLYVQTIITIVNKQIMLLGLIAILVVITNILLGRSDFYQGVKDILYLLLFLAIPLFYLIWADLSHHLSYDDDLIYYRKGDYADLGRLFRGHLYNPEFSMRFDEIDVVVDESNPIFRFPGHPFQYVRLYRKNWDGEEAFWFELLRYKKDSIRALVQLIYDKRPETFTEGMIDYLNADW